MIPGRYVNKFIQIISFFERSSFKLTCETVIGIVLYYSHQACCLLYIWAKLTVAFTCANLPLNLNTSVFRCGCGFGFEQKFWRIDGFGEKKTRIGRFAYPYSPPIKEVLSLHGLPSPGAICSLHGLRFGVTPQSMVKWTLPC